MELVTSYLILSTSSQVRLQLIVINSFITSTLTSCNSFHEFHEACHSFTFLFREKRTPNGAVTPQRQSQFTPKMKANAKPRLLSSLVWIDQCNECNGMTCFMELMALGLPWWWCCISRSLTCTFITTCLPKREWLSVYICLPSEPTIKTIQIYTYVTYSYD